MPVISLYLSKFLNLPVVLFPNLSYAVPPGPAILGNTEVFQVGV